MFCASIARHISGEWFHIKPANCTKVTVPSDGGASSGPRSPPSPPTEWQAMQALLLKSCRPWRGLAGKSSTSRRGPPATFRM